MTEAIDRTHPANSAGITVISLETPTWAIAAIWCTTANRPSSWTPSATSTG